MKEDKRVFELRFNGLYSQPEVFACTDGELKSTREVLKVVPESELTRVQGLLKTVRDFLDEEIAVLPCESRVRTMNEDQWKTAMYLRDLIDQQNRGEG